MQKWHWGSKKWRKKNLAVGDIKENRGRRPRIQIAIPRAISGQFVDKRWQRIKYLYANSGKPDGLDGGNKDFVDFVQRWLDDNYNSRKTWEIAKELEAGFELNKRMGIGNKHPIIREMLDDWRNHIDNASSTPNTSDIDFSSTDEGDEKEVAENEGGEENEQVAENEEGEDGEQVAEEMDTSQAAAEDLA